MSSSDDAKSRFEDNKAFATAPDVDGGILNFQVMQGGHIFQARHLHRFGAFMAFPLGSTRPRPRWTPQLLLNSLICRVFDLIVHKRYMLWLLWNHIGYFSWKYQAMTDSMTTAVPAELPPIPEHIVRSIQARYGEFDYCRYFTYGARDRYVVYWVVLKRNGAILIAEESDGWVGRWGWAMDLSLHVD